MTRHAGVTRLVAVLALALVGSVSAACETETSPVTIPGAAVAVDDPFSGGYPTYDDEASGLRVVVGTPDLGVGETRVSFALFDRDGLVAEPTLLAESRHHPDGPDGALEAVESIELTFRPFPDGGRGIYTGTAHFDRPGLWSFVLPVPAGDEATERVHTVIVPVEVASEPMAIGVGAPAPRSENRTLLSEPNLEQLTTARTPDTRLYQQTVAEAIAAGQPAVVVFTSPAFCTNALCGPQVEVLSELADTYEGEAAFIHIDLYENPTEIRGDLSLARRTPILEEWGLKTDQWTFVVDGAGIVRARFEGFAPREEVEATLLDLLAMQP